MDNLENNQTTKKNTYNKEVQYNYKKDLLQIAFRYSKREIVESEAVKKYMDIHGLKAGEFAKIAIREKLKRDGFLSDEK